MKDIIKQPLTEKYYSIKSDVELYQNYWCFVVVGGRNTGKTYGALKYMYENSGDMYLAMILGSESMGELLTRAEYLSKITAYDREQLVKYQEAKLEGACKGTIVK